MPGGQNTASTGLFQRNRTQSGRLQGLLLASCMLTIAAVVQPQPRTANPTGPRTAGPPVARVIAEYSAW